MQGGAVLPPATAPVRRQLMAAQQQRQNLKQLQGGRLGSQPRGAQPYLGPLDPSDEGSYQLVQVGGGACGGCQGRGWAQQAVAASSAARHTAMGKQGGWCRAVEGC
jgi:hypothetical protein